MSRRAEVARWETEMDAGPRTGVESKPMPFAWRHNGKKAFAPFSLQRALKSLVGVNALIEPRECMTTGFVWIAGG